jgi:predicted esterase
VTRVIAELIVEQAQSPLTCGAPVVTGVSQGGLLALALATHHPRLVGEAIAVAGFLPESMVPESADKRAGQITMLNGKEDRLVPIALVRQTAARLTSAGFQVTLLEQPVASHAIGPLIQRRWNDLLDRALRRACR